MNLGEVLGLLAGNFPEETVRSYATFAEERAGPDWFSMFRSVQELIDDVDLYNKAVRLDEEKRSDFTQPR